MKVLFNRAVEVLKFPWFVTVESFCLGQFCRINFLTSIEIQDQILKSLSTYRSKTTIILNKREIYIFLYSFVIKCNELLCLTEIANFLTIFWWFVDCVLRRPVASSINLHTNGTLSILPLTWFSKGKGKAFQPHLSRYAAVHSSVQWKMFVRNKRLVFW